MQVLFFEKTDGIKAEKQKNRSEKSLERQKI